MLKNLYTALAAKYTTDNELIEKLWNEIEQHHKEAGRYYHTLRHLESLVRELEAVKEQVEDWDSIMFAAFYHDVIYGTRGANEWRSALLAKEHLAQMGYPKEQTERCERHILATEKHVMSDDQDTNLFTDADLCILGKDEREFDEYCAAIRKEFAHVALEVYNPVRAGVLQSFLDMPRIYKTYHFHDLYEATARKNLAKEIERCSVRIW